MTQIVNGTAWGFASGEAWDREGSYVPVSLNYILFCIVIGVLMYFYYSLMVYNIIALYCLKFLERVRWLYGRLIIPLYLLTFSRKIISWMKFFRSLVLSRIKYIEPIYFMLLYDLVSSKFIVIPIIIFTIKTEEVLIWRITN